MQAAPTRIGNDWLEWPQTRAVMKALTADGTAARFVGGCVRNSLLAEPVTDIDIATEARPESVIDRLEAAGLKAVPTGLDHGTVTAIADHHPFEVTTLRVDVETHGRHATVAFTEDWVEDARRRDFTINALYADPDGTIYDPVGGLADIEERRIRFIGDAGDRIEEDALRILRFFRFHAWYGQGAPDADGLAACAAHTGMLANLSVERIEAEMMKLLAAADPVPVLKTMADAPVLAAVLPEAASLDTLAALTTLETRLNRADPVRRLSALARPKAAAAARRWKMSNAARKRLAALDGAGPVPAGLDDRDARAVLYREGGQIFTDRVLLSWAEDGADRAGLLALADGWRRPEFPVDGRDVMALGVPKGPRVGACLAKLEDWWLEKDFAPGREELLTALEKIAGGR